MKTQDKFANFENLKEKQIDNVWCINGGGDHYCSDCCEEDDPRGGTDEG